MYKPFHLIGLELNISILSAALLGQPTGTTRTFTGDVVAIAKRNLKAGEMLDGEGGFTVWGKLYPAARSVSLNALPIGLAHQVRLTADIAAGQPVCWHHIDSDQTSSAVRLRLAQQDKLSPS